jgi:hypothetical protein
LAADLFPKLAVRTRALILVKQQAGAAGVEL